MIPKPRSLRDLRAIKRARKRYCENCPGKWKLEVHHIIPKSVCRLDHPLNLVTLCGHCHYDLIPSGKLTQEMLFEVVAKREGLILDEVMEQIDNLRFEAVGV